MRNLLILAAILIVTADILSQSDKIGYGFRAGPSYSRLDGPSETGPDGEELESYTNAQGFHIGVAVSYKFTDLAGVRGEFTFSQRGTKYNYDGPSYYFLERNNAKTPLDGTRHQTNKVSNAFLDIPIVGYYKLGSFEIAGGVNTGILLSSTGGGSTDFEGVSPLGSAVDPFTVSLDHNYKKDEAGGASEELQLIDIDGLPYGAPLTTGAYYDFTEKNKNLYNTVDFGLVFGASLFINEGLFISFRYIHGLGDVDQNEYDVSLQELNQDGTTILRGDTNSSRSMQFSVGFAFNSE